MSKRTYSDTERATALVLLDGNRGNLSRTERESGVPRSTLREWRDGRHHSEVTDIRQEKKIELAALIEEIVLQALGSITQAKLQQTGAKDLMTIAGIGVDKILALREATPDQNQQNDTLNVFIQTRLGPVTLP